MALKTKTFFEIVENNGLISESKIGKLRSAIKKETLSQPDLKALIAKRVLTKWQVQRFLAGKTNFRIGDYRLLDFVGKDAFGEVYLVKTDQKNSYLRLVSSELCADPEKLNPYLQRVNAFRELKTSRIPAISDVSQINARTLIVSDIPVGESIANRFGGQPQTDASAIKILADLSNALEELQIADLHHGSVSDSTVNIDDQNQIRFHLPGDIGFSSFSSDPSTDVAAVCRIGAGISSGDFKNPSPDGNGFAQQCITLGQKPGLNLTDIQGLLGQQEAPAMVVDGLPSISTTSAPAEMPAAESLGDIPTIQNPLTDAGSLSEISSGKNDMFGDFDQMEVISEIPASQAIVSPNPVIVTAPDSFAQTTSAKPTAKKKTADSDDPQPNSSKRTIILSVVGGVVLAGVVGLIIFMNMGTGQDDNTPKTALESSNVKNSDSKSPTGNRPNRKGEKNSADKDSPKKSGGLKSSGLFKGVGALNQSKTSPSPGPGIIPGGKSLTKVNPKSLDKKTPVPKANPKEPKNKNDAKGTKPKVEPDPKTDPKKDVKSDPKTDPKKDPGVGKSPAPKPPEKNAPKADAQKDNEKKDQTKKKTEPVLLIGGPKKEDPKDPKKGGDSGSLKNPFVQTPRFVTLPPVETLKLKMFELQIPPSLPLTCTLHGGDKASKANITFTLRASTSENATWVVSANTKSSPAKPIARFNLDGNQFLFTWESAASELANVKYLMNCALNIQASEYSHVVALRAPVVSTLLDFEKSFSANAEAQLSMLPDLEHVEVQLVNFSKGFPAHKFPKGKELIKGRSGSTLMRFQKENIDLVAAELTTKTRGSKFFLSFEARYVAPDKKTEKISSFDRFEKQVNAALVEIQQLQVGYNQMMVEYNKIKDANQKRAFSTLHNRVAIETRIRAAKPIKKHVQNTLEILKLLHKAKVGIRVYYQAGEHQVDLATPDGKPYVEPKPAPAKAAAKKK